MLGKLKPYLLQQRVLLIIWVLVAVVASVHLIALGNKTFNQIDSYKHYNNFVIFRYSFLHLIHYQDLYIEHPMEQYDLFKYSPAFALFMFPFAYIPEWLGLILWNVLNALLLFFAFKKAGFVNWGVTAGVLWFVLQETLTGLQSAQTNPMIAALLIFAFAAFEKKQVAFAALMIVLSAFIKLFGIVAFAMFLMYPDKIKFIGWSISWTLLLLILPLMVVSPDQLWYLYNSWWQMLQNDHSVSYGLSVMGWLKSWFGLDPPKLLVVAIGAILLLLPLLKFKDFHSEIYRRLYFAGIMLWVIIFNHKAESSTFVIAVCGAAFWYFSQEPDPWRRYALILMFVFTCLSPTDLFPRFLRMQFVEPYVLKAFPCILIWMWNTAQLISGKYNLRVG